MSRRRICWLAAGGVALASALIGGTLAWVMVVGDRWRTPPHRLDACLLIQSAADRGESRVAVVSQGGTVALIAPYSITPRSVRGHAWIDETTYRELDILDDAPEDVLVVRHDGKRLVEYCHLDSRFATAESMIDIRDGDALMLEYRNASRPVLLSKAPR